MKKSDNKHKKQESEVPKTENEKLSYNPEVTNEDIKTLSQDNLHADEGDDQQLRDRKKKVDFTGEDLDVPGSTTAKESGRKGMEDEENQLFSQGGEDKENLEEDDGVL